MKRRYDSAGKNSSLDAYQPLTVHSETINFFHILLCYNLILKWITKRVINQVFLRMCIFMYL